MSAWHIVPLISIATVVFAHPAPAPAVPVMASAAAPAGNPPASQETNWKGVVADVTELRRSGNTLTAKVRLTNRGSRLSMPSIWFKEVYLIDHAGRKKYQVLRDENGGYIASNDATWNGHLEPDSSNTIWMKFPAPPPDVKAIALLLPGMSPFEDVAIQD